MTKNDILSMLKADLEIINHIKDTYLTQLINVAEKEIKREGIAFNTTTVEVVEGAETRTEVDYEIDDAGLISMYAAYLYRNRVTDSETGYKTALSSTGMPRMLRYALNNRLFEQKMRTES